MKELVLCLKGNFQVSFLVCPADTEPVYVALCVISVIPTHKAIKLCTQVLALLCKRVLFFISVSSQLGNL